MPPHRVHAGQAGPGRGRVERRRHVQAAVGGAGDVQPDGRGGIEHHVREDPGGHQFDAGLARLGEQLPDARGVEGVQPEPGVRGVGVLGLELPPDQAHGALLGGRELGAAELEVPPGQPALDPRALGAALEGAQGHVEGTVLAQVLLAGGRGAPLRERVAGGLGHEFHADRQRRRGAEPAGGVEPGQRLHDAAPVQSGVGGRRGPRYGTGGAVLVRASVVVVPAGGRGQGVRGGDHLGELAAGVVQGLVRVEADHLVEGGGHVLAVRADGARAAPAHRLHAHGGALGVGVVEGLLERHLHAVGARRGALHGGGEPARGHVVAQAADGAGGGDREAAVRTGGSDDGADGLGAQVRQDVSGICSGHSEQSFTDRAGKTHRWGGPGARCSYYIRDSATHAPYHTSPRVSIRPLGRFCLQV